LAEKFGMRRMLKAKVVLPTPEFFPDPYCGKVDDVRALLDRVCHYMGADPARLDLEFYDDHQNPHATGCYHRGEREVIFVARSLPLDPQSLIATLAHEVAHSLLLGCNRVTGEEEDHEWLTDLLPLFLGMGLFAANDVVRDEYEIIDPRSNSWRIARRGYLPARMHGYGMALFARARGEYLPAWAGHLRPDVRVALQQGLKFLEKTGDTLFPPERRDAFATKSEARLIEDLTGASDSARLAALWDLVDADLPTSGLFRAVAECAKHQDPVLRAAAARVLASARTSSEQALELLKELLADLDGEVRAAAAMSLGLFAVREEAVVRELAGLVSDEVSVALAATWSLGQYGPCASSAIPELMKALRHGLIASDSDLPEAILAALIAIVKDPRPLLDEHFSQVDEVLYQVVLVALENAQEEPSQITGPSMCRPTQYGLRPPKGPITIESQNIPM
jgi:hypothetical protein